MNRLTSAFAVALALGVAGPASATIEFDQNVTPDVIFGSGNANGAFTTDRNGGVEVGLRGKLRHNASGAPENTFNSNGDGTYSFPKGIAPTQSFPTAVWSIEWSINSNPGGNGTSLDGLTYELGLDSDPGPGATFTSFDPIQGINPNFGEVRWDHAIGDNNTLSGGGGNFVANTSTYAGALATYNVAQNSWKAHWVISPFDPTVDGNYAVYLLAKDSGGNVVARTDIQILVGDALPIDTQEPAVTDVVATPNPVAVQAMVDLTATASDVGLGDSVIKSAAYSLDGGTGALLAYDGAFNSPSEGIEGSVMAPYEAGLYPLCVNATDVLGNTGADECIDLVVYDPSAGFVTGGGWIISPEGAMGMVWNQDFSVDDTGWFDDDDFSGYGLINVSGGAAVFAGLSSGPFSRFDGYRDAWPGTWTAEIDVYLDPDWPAGQGFDYSVAASGSDGNHQRDYICTPTT